MSPVFIALFTLFASTFRTHTALQAEIAALRHQIAVLQLSAPRRLRLKQSDRFLWILWRWVLAGMAALAPHPEARHGRPLASERVRSLLDMEVAAKARATDGGCLDSRPDSTDESSQ